MRLEGSGGTLDGSFVNAGILSVTGGDVTVTGSVGGFGQVVIENGTLAFGSAFEQNVTFSGKTGELGLAQSQDFYRTITGLAANGKQVLDLDDIGFVSAGEATFSGSAAGGLLTVGDGVHTANLHLVGDYVGDAFTTASDGHGGVVITAAPPQSPSAHAFVAAIASMSAEPAAGALHAGEYPAQASWTLSRPAVR